MAEFKTRISRVRRSKEEAKANYDRICRWYDFLVGKSEKKFRDAGLRTLKAGEDETILEIGFGTGHAVVGLARSVGRFGKVYGIDISPGMYAITQARVEKAGMRDQVELTCGDAADLPFDNLFFDAVFMSFALELFDTPEIPIVLAECQRVLRSGGRLAVVAMAKQAEPGFPVRLYEWAHEKWPSLIDCRPIFVKETIKAAGFDLLRMATMSMWGLPVEVVLFKKHEPPHT